MKTLKVTDITIGMHGTYIIAPTYRSKNKTEKPMKPRTVKLDEIHVYSNGNIKTGGNYLRAHDDIQVFESDQEFAEFILRRLKEENDWRTKQNESRIASGHNRAFTYSLYDPETWFRRFGLDYHQMDL